MSIVSHVPINSRGRSNQKILSGGCIASRTPSDYTFSLFSLSWEREAPRESCLHLLFSLFKVGLFNKYSASPFIL